MESDIDFRILMHPLEKVQYEMVQVFKVILFSLSEIRKKYFFASTWTAIQLSAVILRFCLSCLEKMN